MTGGWIRPREHVTGQRGWLDTWWPYLLVLFIGFALYMAL